MRIIGVSPAIGAGANEGNAKVPQDKNQKNPYPTNEVTDAQWKARHFWIAKMTTSEHETEHEIGIGSAEKLKRRERAFWLSVSRKQERAGRVAAYSADRFGYAHPISRAARAALRELSPDWSRVSPRGHQRSPVGIGGGGYAQ